MQAHFPHSHRQVGRSFVWEGSRERESASEGSDKLGPAGESMGVDIRGAGRFGGGALGDAPAFLSFWLLSSTM